MKACIQEPCLAKQNKLITFKIGEVKKIGNTFAGINIHCKHETIIWTKVTSSIIKNNNKNAEGFVRTRAKQNASEGRCSFRFSRAQRPRQSALPAVTSPAISLFPHYCITKQCAHLPGKDNISHTWGLPLISVVELEVRGLPSPGPTSNDSFHLLRNQTF